MILKRFALLFHFHLLVLGLFQLPCFAAPAAISYQSLEMLRDTIPDTDTVDGDLVFTRVDIEASYPGGENAWRRFLEQNLNPDVPAKKKAPVGSYTVLIQFVVDLDGKVTDIQPLTNHGYGMEQEVIRLLLKAPRWLPAMLEGNPVRAYRKQPVTFMVMEDEKKKKKKDG